MLDAIISIVKQEKHIDYLQALNRVTTPDIVIYFDLLQPLSDAGIKLNVLSEEIKLSDAYVSKIILSV